MIPIPSKKINYSIVFSNQDKVPPYPLIKSIDGERTLWLVGPDHGRSYVVKNQNHHYIVSKGNGLSYTPWPFLNTYELGKDLWGLLLESDARRDFLLGNEISKMGIKTNYMHYVIKLNYPLYSMGQVVFPHLLQYSVDCPYRLSDAAFMKRSQIQERVNKWPKIYAYNYLNAAHILINNLRIMHENGVLHNALTIQNYTWSLELVDFELACSPNYPYENEDYRRHVQDLMPREIIHVYQIINYIAWVLNERVNHYALVDLFEASGFNLRSFLVDVNVAV